MLAIAVAIAGFVVCAGAPTAAYAQVNVRIPGNHPVDFSSLKSTAVSLDRQIKLSIALSLRHRAALRKLIREQQDPSSPEYHRWLTPEEFATRFGPAPQDVQAVKQWLSAAGFKIVGSSGTILRAQGNVGSAASAFAINFLGSTDGRFYANTQDPAIPSRFATVVSSIQGLDNLLHARPAGNRTPAPQAASQGARLDGALLAEAVSPGQFRLGQFGSQPETTAVGATAFAPSDLYTFYDENPLLSGGVDGGGGDCLAVVEDSNFADAAVSEFNSTFSLPPVAVTRVLVDGTNPGFNGDEAEALLDIEWAHAVAPGAPIRAYIGDGTHLGAQGLVDAIAAAVQANSCGSIDISFSFCGASSSFYSSTLDQIFAQAAAQGQSVFISSGDEGAAGLVFKASQNACVTGTSRHVNEMSADPNVSSVGGTQFNPNYDGSGQDVGSVPERAWNETYTQNGKTTPLGASGGGASDVFSKPSYQAGTGVPNDGKRDVPDIAIASGLTVPGFFLGDDPYHSGGAVLDCCWGGTSIGAAMWAGIAKLIAQADIQNHGSGRLGNINPRLYLMGQQMDGATTGIRDADSGNNSFNGVTGFSAGSGYDAATGWGTPDLAILVPAFVTQDFIQVAGNLRAAPARRHFPRQLFSSVGSVSPSRHVIVINRNRTNLPAQIDSVDASGDFSIESNGCSPTVAAGSRCEIDLVFQPSGLGLRTGTLSVSGHFQNSPVQVSLLANAVAPKLRYGPRHLGFGRQTVGTPSAVKTVTLTNTMAVPIDVSSITSSSADFTETDDCVGALAPQAGQCTISVTFTPSILGRETATLTITDDARHAPHLVHLVGHGVSP